MSREQKLSFLLQLHERLQQAAARLAKAHAASGAGTLQPAAGAAAMGAAAAAAAGAAAALAIWPAGSSENEGTVGNAVVPMQLDFPAAAAAAAAAPLPLGLLAASKPAGKAAGGKRKAGGKRAARRADSGTSSEDDDWCVRCWGWPQSQAAMRITESPHACCIWPVPSNLCPPWPAWRRKPEPRAASGRARRGAAAAAAAMEAELPAGGGGGRAAAVAVAAAADVEQLVGMGFSAKQARDALEESGHDLEAAIEWLVAHCI